MAYKKCKLAEKYKNGDPMPGYVVQELGEHNHVPTVLSRDDIMKAEMLYYVRHEDITVFLITF